MWNAIKRFSNWVKALFNRGMDHLEDPEVMLAQARRDMSEAVVENREMAVQAITQQKRLLQMLEEAKAQDARLEQQAEQALKMGNRELALQLMREKKSISGSIEQLQESSDSATQVVEQVKKAIKVQEEQVRQKLAESLALKAQWKQAQIQNSISKALEGLTFDDQFGNTFNEAKERVSMAQAEAAARQEMQGESVEGKILALQDESMDLEAEDELRKLEERLGMTVSMPAVSVEEAELAALELKIGQGQSQERSPGMSP